MRLRFSILALLGCGCGSGTSGTSPSLATSNLRCPIWGCGTNGPSLLGNAPPAAR